MTVTSLDRAIELPLRRMVSETPTDRWDGSWATCHDLVAAVRDVMLPDPDVNTEAR